MLEDKLKNYKKWYIGDTFALEIKKCQYQEYIGKYLIFHYLGKNNGDEKCLLFRVKICKNNIIPTTKEEIEKIEYVKTRLTVIENAYFRKEDSFVNSNVIPDEYGYLHTYLMEIYTTSRKYKVRNDLIYIGNFDLTVPEDEYIASNHVMHLDLWENVDNFIIESYIRYNLKDPKLYNFECASKMHQEAREVNEAILETLNNINENKEKFKKEKMTFDSITYVGEDPNHLDYKK